MTPTERTAKIAELRAEADRLEREGALPALTLEWCDEIWRNCPRGISTAESVKWVIEQDRARTTIKAPDAPEPTGADLVGRVCQLSLYPIKDNSDGIRDTVVMYDAKRDEYHGDGGQSKPWKYARLYREDQP